MIAPNNKRAPAGHGGGSNDRARGSYSRLAPEATWPGNWFNPRRRLHAERLLAYVTWNGGKINLTPDRLADLRQHERLDAWAVFQAADDLYILGVADIHMAAAAVVVVALAPDLDVAAPEFRKGVR
jgi:hypothetical protein